MNKALLQEEVQKFILNNIDADVSKLILKGSSFKNISSRELAIQITAKKKANKKLPRWFNAESIIFPPNINLEQTSSEITARYKAKSCQRQEADRPNRWFWNRRVLFC
ncbi:hypothetical protein [Antarcticibacterium sp. 1MA-6-2]|uniref:hypothetical protein n=1 Tax=Antarcticibacterium sp. 1MA-6-2 TaxID=2908210 RepID=UPI002882D4FA|nr:hypothetical protein [Antarcticibacterium sp. 1MA-6-2]